MKKYEVLSQISLFKGLDLSEGEKTLDCFGFIERRYSKDVIIFHGGEQIEYLGIILKGSINIVSNDFWGNRTIIEKIGPGKMFAETISFSGTDKLPFSVISAEESVIMYLHGGKILSPCDTMCGKHTIILRNMLRILADKNILLAQKIGHLSKRTTKEKLMSYLSVQSAAAGFSSFHIPFNRQELADYLSVDRSAMSAELSRLRDEGVLAFHKNEFELYKN